MLASSLSRLALGLSLLTSAYASCLHGTTLFPRSGTVPVSNFTYDGTLKGPINWDSLSTANAKCRSGKNQTPIILTPAIPYASSNPTLNYPDVFSGAPFENLGSTVEVVVNGTATYNGTTYSLKQYHFHTPSEHRINGEYYPLEMHLVHQSSGGKILVIGILFDVDFAFTTSLVTSTILNLQSITTPGTQTKTGPLEFEEIIANIARGKLYQYTGSLTTPPCTEGVQWLVLATPQPLNVDSYNALKKVLKFNARYTQNTLGQTNVLQLHKC